MSLSLRPLLRDFAAEYPPYNDFSVVTLHCFDDGLPKLSQLNGNLILRPVDPANGQPYLTLLGQNKVKETWAELLHSRERSSSSDIPAPSAIPEVVVDRLPDTRWGDQPEATEYVYSIQYWLDASTSRLRAKQRRAQRFQERHPQARFAALDLNSRGVCHGVANFASACWLKNGPLDSGLVAELLALQRSLADAEPLGLSGYCLKEHDELLGYMILEPVHGGWVHTHFGCFDHRLPGLAEHFLFQMAHALRSRGLTHINDHEDLGQSGLRQFKKSWEPVQLLRKYHWRGTRPGEWSYQPEHPASAKPLYGAQARVESPDHDASGTRSFPNARTLFDDGAGQ